MPIITLPENNKKLSAAAGTTLLDVLKENGIYPDAPCGGNGTCGKRTMLVNGTEVLACRTVVDRDMTEVLPQAEIRILQDRFCTEQGVDPLQEGHLLAFDIGTNGEVDAGTLQNRIYFPGKCLDKPARFHLFCGYQHRRVPVPSCGIFSWNCLHPAPGKEHAQVDSGSHPNLVRYHLYFRSLRQAAFHGEYFPAVPMCLFTEWFVFFR